MLYILFGFSEIYDVKTPFFLNPISAIFDQTMANIVDLLLVQSQIKFIISVFHLIPKVAHLPVYRFCVYYGFA